LFDENKLIKPDGSDLFDRVVSILEQARSNVVRSINNNMVIAYWLIGKEIVQEIQRGEERADYGKKIIEKLSLRLTEKFGRGFSTTNLRYFRTFYLSYTNRIPEIRHTQSGVLDNMSLAIESAECG
jgi:hypothetical protein